MQINNMDDKFEEYLEELRGVDNIFAYRLDENGKCISVIFPAEIDDIVPEADLDGFEEYFKELITNNELKELQQEN